MPTFLRVVKLSVLITHLFLYCLVLEHEMQKQVNWLGMEAREDKINFDLIYFAIGFCALEWL